MQSPEKIWRFKLPASPIRLFIKGDVEGLPGLIEVRQLRKGSPFYLAAHQDCCELLQRWGESSCQGFKKLSIVEGLPQGWHFFEVAAAHSDEMIKERYPILAFSTTVRMELEGGIRIDRGNRFFKFAPPKIFLKGSGDRVQVYCNERLLDCAQTEGIYELPADSPSEIKLAIAVFQGDNLLKSKSLFLVDDFPLAKQSTQQFNCFGYRQEADNDSASVRGALLQNVNSPPFDFNTFLPVQGKQRIFFVGKEPGMVAIWPDEPLPIDWSPVWAIAKGRRCSQVMFCGMSLTDSEPTPSKCKNKRKVSKWKDLLWHDRKKISPPTNNSLRELWKRFREEAKCVR